MNNKKRNKYDKHNYMALPLEKTEIIIENIYNLKHCLNLYRKELQEKNNYIDNANEDLKFYKSVLRNINVVWKIFNSDLLNLINNDKGINVHVKEENNNNNDNIKECKKREIKDEKSGDEYENMIESPYYNIENVHDLFLKYVNKNDGNESDEEEDSDFFKSLSEDDIENIKGKYKKIKINEQDAHEKPFIKNEKNTDKEKGYTNTKRKRDEKGEDRESSDNTKQCNGEKNSKTIFEEKIKFEFLENIKKTLNFINNIICLKSNINIDCNLEYIRKINYEKNVYYEKYKDEKKNNNNAKNEYNNIKIELERLEKKKASLLFKLYNLNICKTIIEDVKVEKPEDIMQNELKLENFDEAKNKIICVNCGYENLCENSAILSELNSGMIAKNESNSLCAANQLSTPGNTINGNSNTTNMNSTIGNSGKNENDNIGNKVESEILLNFENLITKEKIIQSDPFKNLVKETMNIYNTLKEREKEIVLLKKEILRMENDKDEEYDNLLNETINNKKTLVNKIKELEIEIVTYRLDKDTIENKINAMKNEVNVLKNIENNQTTQLKQKENEILKMKSNIDALKMSENNLKEKIEIIKKEKNDLLSSEGCMIKNVNINNGNAIGDDLKNQTSVDIDKYNELLRENENIRKILEKKKDVEDELINLKSSYNSMSEEIEEITKEFEKKQEQIDEMILQIKNKEMEYLKKYNNMVSKEYAENNLKQLENSYKEKLSLINDTYDKYKNFSNLYLSLFYHARRNAVISDSAKEEQMNIIIKLKEKYESIFQKKKELSGILKNLYNCNKKLITKCNDLYKENKKLQNTLCSMEKNKYKKNLSPNNEDNNLLIEENNELRRRLICSVCMENFRNYIIIKCGHIYCETCIFNNLKSRNRKCPQCKIPFDKKDLQKMFLD
ncbi:trophozoite exported protein 1, putative [Plasmodium berghei]|uniref:E3 ubiquitin protein ligase n=2 Tax=Plasmodium berghei TaxID=5821 RepID=A0A509ADN4_PLABA|nr:trophozoite exported protein 1, putative [Plasmodium berghei ANKA]CXH79919.1 trophozoite exported protein 1, putative [Plasmodium berghei]SCM18994.1 trophozoite exported protein 1, putative [Plasmodium berghei]SCN21531.1 trophozoite exported protein 1, putative [Plasmodium berghei]SCO58775.1 trophozoite exported protein 1, putative [Plasmodium berghei]SCO58805.1 trophozoite exported protein 1, putative [Plasmodium berghei]|eukprot:XP_034419622.1 trophozoite exported protein 1, putative [Plasmodium berghei ANKA]